MLAVVVHLSGWWALFGILVLSVVACLPVWVLTWWVSRWAQRRIEMAFRRRLTEMGVPSAEIDEAWRAISRGELRV